MSSEWYQVLSLGARYWFALLGVVIVWRALRWQLGDSKRRKQVMRNLPDAGYIGTLYVLEGESDAFDEGDSINIPAEGVLGSAMGCDVFIPHPSIAARHMLFHLFPDGLHVRAYRDQQIAVDGEVLAPGEQAILLHGAILVVGTVELQLRLFVGVVIQDAQRGDPKPQPGQAKGGGKAAKKKKKKLPKGAKRAALKPVKPQTQSIAPEEAEEEVYEEDFDEDFDEDFREEAEEVYDEEGFETNYEDEEAPWSTNTWGNPFDEDDNRYH